MGQSELAIVVSPGDNHVGHLSKLYRSIIANSRETPDVWLFASCAEAARRAPRGIKTRVVGDADLRMMKELYFQEGRADIQPFAAYAQLWIPGYFNDYRKILFMEVDQLVVNRLDGLFLEITQGDIRLGAARSFNPTSPEPYTSPASFRRIHATEYYYNTGVMVVDSDHWNRSGFLEKCLNELRIQKQSCGSRLDFYAQGAINNALADAISLIDGKYNYGGLGWLPDLNRTEFRNAVILHWVGPRKPWMVDGLYQDWYYLSTPFSALSGAVHLGALRIARFLRKAGRE